MPQFNVTSISEVLTRLQLVEPEQLAECISLVSRADGADLLELMQARGYLTGFQVERLKKQDTDGLVLDGYKLMYRNAAGSFARVYRACSIADGSMIAMKVLRERWATDDDTVALFHREGEIGQRLKHEHIVPIFDTGISGKYHYISMEFVEGGNLRDFIQIRKKLDPAEAMRYALHMSEALKYATQMNITHRDLKMTNVLMSSQGEAKLIDFGLAADDSLLNRVGGPDLQTALEYSTLEKGTGAPRNDPRSDLFFLGVILYELVTGEPPYARTRSREDRKRIGRYRNIRPITSLEPSLPWSVADIIDRLLHTNPSERFQSPSEVIQAIQAAHSELKPVEVPVPARVAHASDASDTSQQNGKTEPTVMCVEDRVKQQDWLRDYLTKHGYRVLMLRDVDRAILRVESDPPDCIVFFGDSIGDRVVDDFRKAVKLSEEKPVSCLLVLSEKQLHYRNQLADLSDSARIITQPVKLRELRQAIGDSLTRGPSSAR